MARRRTLRRKRKTYRKSINNKRRKTYRKTRKMIGGPFPTDRPAILEEKQGFETIVETDVTSPPKPPPVDISDK